MPRCIPEEPSFATGAERALWQRLRAGPGAGDLLVGNQRIASPEKDHELDVVVGWPVTAS